MLRSSEVHSPEYYSGNSREEKKGKPSLRWINEVQEDLKNLTKSDVMTIDSIWNQCLIHLKIFMKYFKFIGKNLKESSIICVFCHFHPLNIEFSKVSICELYVLRKPLNERDPWSLCDDIAIIICLWLSSRSFYLA